MTLDAQKLTPRNPGANSAFPLLSWCHTNHRLCCRTITEPRHGCRSPAHPAALKLVGSNGQISLGKQYAGRHVLVKEREPGVWVIRTAWEKITSIKPPAGIDAVDSLRISQSRRATAHRDGDFIRLLTIAPDHDANDGKK